MRFPPSYFTVYLVVFTLIGGVALAHSGATGIVKERMDAMKDIAAQMKVIGEMVKGQRGFDAGTAAVAAAIVAGHAEDIPAQFPEGSDDAPSEALPAIWADWDSFVGSAGQLEVSAMDLSEAAKSASNAGEIAGPFAAVGRTCSACHEDFRETN